MKEQILTLNAEAGGICDSLCTSGFLRVQFQRYHANGALVESATALGDIGEGLVAVTAIQEGQNSTYMMQGPPRTEGGTASEFHGDECTKGTYQEVAHELLRLLAQHPGEGSVQLSVGSSIVLAD